ncbi:streptococcal hemagglutinin-like isoform X2 [Littorina saxatilis]|uniref:streptococcal hemagglutinin-like isoform X2 n=1 Tax=Littorina saxatilis TaxID=31220 RepID=UPI0038B5F081
MGKRAKNNRMQTDGSKTAVDSNHLEASSSTKLKRKSKGAKKKRQQWFNKCLNNKCLNNKCLNNTCLNNKCLNNKEKKGPNSKQSSNISVPLLPLPSVSSLQTPIPLTAGDAQRPGPSSTVTAGTDPDANSTHTPSTPSGPHRPPLLSMPLDRPAQRDMPWEHPGPAFKHNYFQDNSYNDYGSSGHYIDFSQDWPDPRGGPAPRWDRAPYRWQRGQAQESHNQGGWNRMGNGRGEPREFPGRQGPGERNQAWGSGARGRETEGRPPGPDGNHRGRPRPPRLDPRSRQPAPSKGRRDGSGGDTNGSPWNQLAKSFGSEHFHREEAGSGDLSSSGGSLRAAQADSSGLEDSGGSLGGKKRPRSLDREGKLSKSSRAEKSSTSGSGSLVASSRALSLTDLSGGEFQKPDSTSRPRTAHKALAPGKATGGPVGKKKQVGLKNKGVAGPTAAKTANSKTDKPDAEASDEGVLERAERMCKELREKRQEARVRSTSSDQRVAALRSALNTSARHFNSVHKSFFKGYASDSGTVPSTASSTAQKKHFSSSASSTESQTRPKSASITAAANLQESQASVAASATSSLSQVSNKERIRHSIENSVRAERQVGKPTNRGPSSSAPHSLAASTSSLPSAATSRKKPPLPLSKDALAKMVSAPRSRTQRSQLARMLRQHTVTVSAQPKRVHLDGLYDNADDDEGDSIEDVLKNISGLEELGDCAELKNIKLEDLTSEDKHIIAQLIEDVDSTDRESLYGGRELADVVVLPQAPEVHSSSSFGRSEPSVIDVEMLVDRSRSPHRLQAPSPTPCQPLSLDDLNTERMQQETVIRSTLARSKSPELSHARSAVVQALSPTRSSSEMRTVPDRMVTESGRPASRTGSGRDVDRYSPSPVAVAMEAAEAPEPSRVVLGGDSLPSRSVGVLHEVMSLSHQQDAVVAEMRDIDVELSQMYKSLIEIVARMSGLQRRRVQLQSEGEQISQRRNHLLSGLLPDAAVSLSSSTAAAIERRRSFSSAASSSFPQNAPPSAAMDHTGQTASNTPQGASSRPPMGSSVTLPSWLSVPSPSARPAAERHREGRGGSETSVPATEQTSDYCLSGSVTSSVGSLTPRAASRSSVNSVQEVVTAEDQASSSALKYKPTAPRTMLSINGVTERNRPDGESSEKEIMVSSVSNVSVEGSHSVKSSVAADSSSGIGSSVGTAVVKPGIGSSVGTAVVKPGQSTSDHQNSSSALSSAASSLNRQQAGQPHTSQSSDSSRLLLNSFTSPQPTNPNRGGDQVKSPGVSVAYLGSLSSDLVQQIVRNLPKTSQLGEANVPSMFVVRPGNSPQPSAAPAEAKSRSRTTSLHSISSDLSSGEHNFMSCVPPLQLGGSDKGGGSKTCTPRSESDAHSVTSGTSLGEQIKLFSELNTAGQRSASSLGDLSHLDIITLEDEDPPVESFAVGDMPDCSVLLQRLDGEKWGENSPGRRQEEDDADRPKKRKTKKDRNQSHHHRRHHVVDSSSEGEGEEDGKGDNSLPDIVISPKQQTSARSSKSVQRVGSDFESEDGEMDSTLVGGELQLSQEAMSEDESGSQTSLSRPLSPSRCSLSSNFLVGDRQGWPSGKASAP